MQWDESNCKREVRDNSQSISWATVQVASGCDNSNTRKESNQPGAKSNNKQCSPNTWAHWGDSYHMNKGEKFSGNNKSAVTARKEKTISQMKIILNVAAAMHKLVSWGKQLQEQNKKQFKANSQLAVTACNSTTGVSSGTSNTATANVKRKQSTRAKMQHLTMQQQPAMHQCSEMTKIDWQWQNWQQKQRWHQHH